MVLSAVGVDHANASAASGRKRMGSGVTSDRGARRGVGDGGRVRLPVLVGVVALAAVAVIGFPFGYASWTWSRLHSTAGRFEPDGFTEVARVRQGQGFCLVSCSGGGEAIITIVLDASEVTADQACGAGDIRCEGSTSLSDTDLRPGATSPLGR